MDNLLHVWVHLEEGEASAPARCGVLERLPGRRCLFSYAAAWLAHPKAFALSPDLPLRAGSFEPPPGLDLHPVFEDAGPDRWGKNIIHKVFNPERRSALEYLELAGEDRIGALGFSRSADTYSPAQEQAFSAADLGDLLRAADAAAAQMPVDDAMRRLLRPGASAGGAHPKAIIRHNGAAWLAKFPGGEDDCDVCALEHASLRLAAMCGIAVPESQLARVGRKNVLLVRRFDRLGRLGHEGGTRLHFASARSILLAEGIPEEAMGYADLADAARRLCADPKADCAQLFRRMLFNILIENTDDHAKNHAFLWRHGQWSLSPAYDIQPQRQGIGYQQLRIGRDGHEPTLSNALSEASRFLLKKGEADGIKEELLRQVRGWASVFAACGVAPQDIAFCAAYVLRASVLK